MKKSRKAALITLILGIIGILSTTVPPTAHADGCTAVTTDYGSFSCSRTTCVIGGMLVRGRLSCSN